MFAMPILTTPILKEIKNLTKNAISNKYSTSPTSLKVRTPIKTWSNAKSTYANSYDICIFYTRLSNLSDLTTSQKQTIKLATRKLNFATEGIKLTEKLDIRTRQLKQSRLTVSKSQRKNQMSHITSQIPFFINSINFHPIKNLHSDANST